MFLDIAKKQIKKLPQPDRSSDKSTIFYSKEIPKRLEEESIFPAREELLRVLTQYKDLGKSGVQDYQTEESLFSLMPRHKPISDIHFLFYFNKPTVLRSAIIFSFLALVASLAIPGMFAIKSVSALKTDIMNQGLYAAVLMDNGAAALANRDFVEAKKNFKYAQIEIESAQFKFNSFGAGALAIMSSIPISNPLRSGSSLLDASWHLSLAGQNFSQLFSDLAESKIINLVAFSGTSVSDNQVPAINLNDIASQIIFSAQEVSRSNKDMQKVNISDAPESLRDKLSFLKQMINEMSSYFDSVISNQKNILDILGASGPRRYLFVFQNSSELRATGGFPGNIALLKIDSGKIAKFEFYDVYDLDGQLVENIVPPKPIQDIASAWSMHDANWFFDFPSSAQKMSVFYEKDGGSTPDGVIAITNQVAEALLSVLGTVELDDYSETLRADNFVDLINEAGETSKNAEAPKQHQVLEGVFNAMLERLPRLNTEEQARLIKVLIDGIASKDIQIFLRNSQEQKFISNLGLSASSSISLDDGSGASAQSSKFIERLAIVHSNINGFKTDRVIDEKLKIETTFTQDGFAENTVIIVRKHNGRQSPYVFYNKVNKDYVRLYVTSGSVLVEASGVTKQDYKPPLDYSQFGFVKDDLVSSSDDSLRHDDATGVDVFQENGRTVFGAWNFVSPGETVVLTFKYKAPISLYSSNAALWNMIVEKQAGISQDIDYSVDFPMDWEVVWADEKNMSRAGNHFSYQGRLNSDLTFKAVIKHQ